MKKRLWLAAAAGTCALMGFVAVACDKKTEVSYQFNTMCDDVTVADVKVTKGEEFTLPTPSSRGKEWEFAGWYLSEDFSGARVTTVVAEEGTVYYAKWEQRYKLTLDLNGGTLANVDDLYLKAGESVVPYLADYVPAKSGYEFARWLNGTSLINASFRMPSSALTLSAEYKVGYTIDVYTQSIDYLRAEDKTGLEEFEKETVTMYAYSDEAAKNENEKFKFDYKLQGFYEINHEGSVFEGGLKENPQEGDNHFVIYFNRELYTLTLNPNVSDTVQGEVRAQYYYDEEAKLPYDLYMNIGYVFAGWSKSSSGENDYPISYIDAVLYNKEEGDDSEVVRAEYRVNGDATLYAYWNEGYTDLFGGADTIFLLDEKSEDIYLFRGGKYFKGEYFAKANEFTFYDKKENILIEGKMVGDKKFCYSDESRSEVSAKLLVDPVRNRINDNVTLSFGLFNELTYTEKDEWGFSTTARGTFSIDEETGEFVAYFATGTGDLVGKTVHIILKTNSRTGIMVFQIRDEEQYALGTVGRLLVNGSSITGITNPDVAHYYSITFSGYGDAVYYNGASPVRCYTGYDKKTDTYTLLNASGNVVLTFKLVSEGAFEGYMPYDATLDDEFESSNGKLILDGIARATYVSGSEISTGIYTLSSSYLGLYLISFNDNGRTNTFLLKSVTEGTGDDAVTFFVVEEKNEGYAEYLYYEDGTLYYPILVLDEEVAGKASLYVNFGSKKTKGATANYAYDSESGLYTLTDIEVVSGVDFENSSRLDLSKLSSWVFRLDTGSMSDNVFYVYSLTDLENNETIKTKEYTPVDKDGNPLNDGSKLLLVGGIAVLSGKNEEGTIVGTYKTDDAGVTTITTGGGYLLVEIYEESNTFLRYDSAPYTAYLYREDGSLEQYEMMKFDGKGGVTYQFNVSDDEETKAVVYVGSVEEAGSTSDGYPIYRFTGTTDSTLVDEAEKNVSFRFIYLTASNYLFFSKISDNEGTFTSSEDGTVLVLDGAGFNARYTDTFNRTYSGMYRARSGNIVYMYVGGEYLYFELDAENHTFTRLGSELGTYIVMDNQVADGRLVELDGRGNATLLKLDDTAEDKRKVVDGEATYALNSDGTFTVSYSADGIAATLTGRLGTIQMGDYYYNVFFISYDSIANTYVNEADYSVLLLDDAGSALRYTQTGRVELGSYTLITDQSHGSSYNLLYYVNQAGTFATLYEYDTVTKLIKRVESSSIAYCNEELSTLMFTQYGFAIFDGTTRYYYYNEGNDVAIYRIAKEGEAANDFGFIKDVIEGGLANSIDYNGTTYYRNGGFDVTFKRQSGEKAYFPEKIQIKDENDKVIEERIVNCTLGDVTFALSGSSEFSVAGKIALTYELDGKTETISKDCTIVRSLVESDGTGEARYETYVTIGFYRYDVNVSYSGEPTNRTYTLNKMSYYIDAQSQYYLQGVLMSMMYGMDPSQIPFYGHITIWQDFDENGVAGPMYMSGKFSTEYRDANGEKKLGSVVGLYGADGSVIDFEESPCEYEISDGNEIFTVTVTHTDGYTYKGMFTISNFYGATAYTMIAFYREQKIRTADNKYEFTVGRVVTSEIEANSPGKLVLPALKNLTTGEEIEEESFLSLNGDYYLVSRTYDDPESQDKKIVASTYYKIALTETDVNEINEKLVKPYDTVAVTPIDTIETVYMANGNYVDINTANNSVLIYNNYIAASTDSYEYDADTKTATYIVTRITGRKYKITVTENDEGEKLATVELYVEPEQE